MDKTAKTVKRIAKDESKHRAKGRKLWAKSYADDISEKRAKKLRRKAKFEYDMADSINTAQRNLPDTTIYDYRKYNIASSNDIASGNKFKLAPRYNSKTTKNQKTGK